MKKDFGCKTWLFPQPVIIIGTYDKNGNANAMNAAWGGMYDYDKVVIALSKHKTTENLKASKAFTLSFATKNTVEGADYVGIVSQEKEPNKLKKAGFSPIKSDKVNAPLFEELPLSIECQVDTFNENDGVLIGKIINVKVDEKFVKNGRVDTESMEIIVFDPINNKYRLVGKEIAEAFKVGLNRR